MGDSADEVMGIGDFALLTGLSVPRLRRYHEMGLLVPSRVDEATGYRSYSPAQAAAGRAIARLREVELPLDELTRAFDHPGERAALLRRHRLRLTERIGQTQRMVELVDQLIAEERPMTANLQLVEVILRVDDVDATVDFYRDVLGIEFQPDDHNGTLPLHFDACGGSWNPEGFFMFTIYPADGHQTRTNLGFGVPNVDEVWDRARAHGATDVAPPAESGYVPRQAIFEDIAGNRVNIYERADW